MTNRRVNSLVLLNIHEDLRDKFDLAVFENELTSLSKDNLSILLNLLNLILHIVYALNVLATLRTVTIIFLNCRCLVNLSSFISGSKEVLYKKD